MGHEDSGSSTGGPSRTLARVGRRDGSRTGPRDERLSRLRQRLGDLEGRRADLLRQAATPGWMVKGTFARRMKACGNPRCRCARGALHGPETVFLFQEGSRRRSATIRPDDEGEIEERYRRYRAYRGALRDLRVLEKSVRAVLGEIAAFHLCDAAALVRGRR